MARSLYIAASGPGSGKSALAVGVADRLSRRVERVAVFRPVVRAEPEHDPLIEVIRDRLRLDLPYDACVGVTYDDVHANPDRAMADILTRYRLVERGSDAVVVIGTDYTDVSAATEFDFNTRLAVNFASAVVGVVGSQGRTADDVVTAVELDLTALLAARCSVVAMVANRVDPALLDDIRHRLERLPVPTYVVPAEPLLAAPTMADLLKACDGRLLAGDPELLRREALRFVVAAMTLPQVLDRLVDECVVITPGDRPEILVGVVMANAAKTFPSLAGVVLTGGFEPPEQVSRLLAGVGSRIPLVVSPYDTFPTATRLSQARGRITPETDRKVEVALSLFENHVDGSALLDRANVVKSDVVTPLMFEHEIIDRARADRRHIVLPEGDDPRILRATASLLRRGVVDITLLGAEPEVRAKAARTGVDISAAKVIDPHDSRLRGQFAEEYARVRAHRGMTLDLASDVVVDATYFGTLMVQLGLADGMVSGATHTTAHTIRPAFEIIRTIPGVSVVSSVFFMCLPDRVLVYSDCAVNPMPDAEQLADIALSSAQTAKQFGIEPRVAMLSYSTGTSGQGVDVEKVRRATELVRQREPDLPVEGPIQYDAAIDAGVARTKLPESAVAGRATVFVFPDLNTGNNTYKAVQRSTGAVAVGPILQGLRKPINDLSRGSTVKDIINTIAITAIQAQAVAAVQISERLG